MNVEVELPELGPDGGDQATVDLWHFDEGDAVEEGDILLEATTEAGTIEVRAPHAGILLERVVDEDEIVRVGETVALLDCAEDDDSAEDDE